MCYIIKAGRKAIKISASFIPTPREEAQSTYAQIPPHASRPISTPIPPIQHRNINTNLHVHVSLRVSLKPGARSSYSSSLRYSEIDSTNGVDFTQHVGITRTESRVDSRGNLNEDAIMTYNLLNRGGHEKNSPSLTCEQVCPTSPPLRS